MTCNTNRSKHLYADCRPGDLYVFPPDVAALLRLCGQTLPENSMNYLKLLANLHYDYFSRPTHHSASKICMEIATYITFPRNPPTCAAVRPFSSTANFRASLMQPGQVSLATQILPIVEDTLPGQEKVSRPSRSILPRSTTQPIYMTHDG